MTDNNPEEFAQDQSTKCAEFKQACGGNDYDLSGEDWCEIPYKYYVPKKTLYPSQTQCHSLKFLLDTWEGQLNARLTIDPNEEGFPKPKWPSDPFTRQIIDIPVLLRLTDQWTNMGKQLPEKLQHLTNAIKADPTLWQTTLVAPPIPPATELPIDTLLWDMFYLEDTDEEADLYMETMGVQLGPITDFAIIFREFIEDQDLIVRDLLTPEQFNEFVDALPAVAGRIYGSPEYGEEMSRILAEYNVHRDVNTNRLATIIANGLIPEINRFREGPMTQDQTEELQINVDTWVSNAMHLYLVGAPIPMVGIALDFINAAESILASQYPNIPIDNVKEQFADFVMNVLISNGPADITNSDFVNGLIEETQSMRTRARNPRGMRTSLMTMLNRIRENYEEND